jgi:hypothetical protein
VHSRGDLPCALLGAVHDRAESECREDEDGEGGDEEPQPLPEGQVPPAQPLHASSYPPVEYDQPPFPYAQIFTHGYSLRMHP